MTVTGSDFLSSSLGCIISGSISAFGFNWLVKGAMVVCLYGTGETLNAMFEAGFVLNSVGSGLNIGVSANSMLCIFVGS